MQIAETLNQGLRREYSLVIPAAALAARVDARLAEVSKQVRMPGFRPGKVPPNLVRKMHGAALRGEALQEAINEGVQQLLADRQLRPATQPQVDLAGDDDGEGDVGLKVALEILPTVEDIRTDDLALERLVVAADDAALDAAVARLAASQQRSEPAPEGHAAVDGDTVVIDFEGRVDGELFDGGAGTDMRVTLGQGQLIPGFEAQLTGVTIGEERTISVSFPEDYGVAYLKGRPAEFKVTVKGIEAPVAQDIDDAFAQSLGIDTLDALKDILKDQLSAEFGQLTRTHLKRKLLDTLAERHDFEVPESMVEAEFAQIWQQLEQEASQDADPATARASIETERGDYRRIAERRVRLGLLLSEIGTRNGITVSQAEMNRLIGQEAARYPGEQAKVVKFFQENAMAAAQLRAPLYEDKVVDFLLAQATLTERSVSRAELEAAIEAEEDGPAGHVHGPDCDHDHDHHGHDHHGHDHGAAEEAAKPKRKAKAKAEEPTAEAVTEAPVDEPAPAKKPRAKAAKPASEAAAPAEAAAESAPAKPKRAKKAGSDAE